VIRTVRRHPFLVFETLAAKVGVILALVLFCANVGLVAACKYPKHWSVEVAFWNAIAFQALFGVLAIPVVPYLLGLITFTVIYAAVSIDVAIQGGGVQNLLRLIRLEPTRCEASNLTGSRLTTGPSIPREYWGAFWSARNSGAGSGRSAPPNMDKSHALLPEQKP